MWIVLFDGFHSPKIEFDTREEAVAFMDTSPSSSCEYHAMVMLASDYYTK